MSTRETPVSIDGPCGPLEALYLDLPDAHGIALVCHPHLLFAGTIQDKVVAILQCSACDADLVTLRPNFRGVGQSAGSYGEEIGEIDDTEAAARWLLARHLGPPLILMGFPSGSCVAGSLAGRLEAEDVGLAWLFMIAPPVERFAVSLPARCPLTVVQPEDDDTATPAAVYAWGGSLARPYELLWVAESGYFFHGKLIDLEDLLLPRLQD